MFVPTLGQKEPPELTGASCPFAETYARAGMLSPGFQGVDDIGRIFKPRLASAHGQPHQTTDLSTMSGPVRGRPFLHVRAQPFLLPLPGRSPVLAALALAL